MSINDKNILKYKEYKIPIYFGDLIVIITRDITKTCKKLKIYKKSLKKYESVVIRKNEKNGYTRYFILLEPRIKLKVIAHEAKHAVNRIFEDRSIDLDLINDEHECYLLGWIWEKTYNLFKNVNK